MKRIAIILLSVLLMMLCACANAEEKTAPGIAVTETPTVPTEKSSLDLLAEQHWYNIHNGDRYVLNTDGSGNHNGISLTFTAEDDRVSIMEGVAALQAKPFRLDRSGPYPRLIPDGETSFYVMETDYRELAPMVRRESIQILLSYELWKVSTMNGYLTFYENGTGSLKAPQSNVKQDTTWEMIDNNTLRCYLPVDSTKQGVNDLEIVNDNGQYRLLTEDPSVYYTPQGDPRPATARTSAIVAVDTAIGYTICLTKDGAAVSVGIDSHGQRKTDSWKNLTAVRGANMHTVGLRADGTVIATGDNGQGQCNVGSWSNIASVDAGYFHTVALRKDGTAVGTGYTKNGQCHLQSWKDLTALSAGGYHTMGLKKDGTVVAQGFNEDGRCDVQSWENIVAISGGGYHSVGLKADGTVVAVGQNKYGQCDVDGWTDIVAVSAGEYHTVGLKADGTVVAVGSNTYNQCRTGAWCDIIAISAGGAHTVGLKENGAVVIIGNNELGQSEADALMKTAS